MYNRLNLVDCFLHTFVIILCIQENGHIFLELCCNAEIDLINSALEKRHV